MKKSSKNLLPASRFGLFFIAFSAFLLVLASYQIIFAQVEMEEMMESLMEEVRQETRQDIIQQNKSDTRVAIASDVVRGVGGPFSGLYIGGSSSYFHNLQITQTGSSYTGTDESIHATVTGSITGNSITYSITCTGPFAGQTASGSGSITGSGEVGTNLSGSLTGVDCEDGVSSSFSVNVDKIS